MFYSKDIFYKTFTKLVKYIHVTYDDELDVLARICAKLDAHKQNFFHVSRLSGLIRKNIVCISKYFVLQVVRLCSNDCSITSH